MPFEDNKKSYMDTLFSIATLLKKMAGRNTEQRYR